MRADSVALNSAQSQAFSSRFTGKVALLSGASDRGIGGAIAERLAEEGAAVSLFSLDAPTRLIDRLERRKADICYARCDVTCQQDVERVVDETLHRFGRIDVVVNNAGEEIAESFEKLVFAWEGFVNERGDDFFRSEAEFEAFEFEFLHHAMHIGTRRIVRDKYDFDGPRLLVKVHFERHHAQFQ